MLKISKSKSGVLWFKGPNDEQVCIFPSDLKALNQAANVFVPSEKYETAYAVIVHENFGVVMDGDAG